MPEIISKEDDSSIRVTSGIVISIKQLEYNKKSLTLQIESLQKQLDLINARLAEADKLGVKLSVTIDEEIV